MYACAHRLIYVVYILCMCICMYTSAHSMIVEIVGTGRLAAEMAVITAKVDSPHALGCL